MARDYESTPLILRECGFTFNTFKTVGTRYTRLLGALKHFDECTRISRQFEPSLIVGFGVDAAVTAARLRVPSVVFIDDDQSTFQNRITSMLGSTIITPFCFMGNLGKKHIRINGFKELAYLHPNYFKPDIRIFEELKLRLGEEYVILRFSSMDAVHDIRNQGLSETEKYQLVQTLSRFARVFISPEGTLPDELRHYQLATAYHRFHHVLHYARMFVSDTGTSASEAAILGTPAVIFGEGITKMGNFQCLCEREMLFNFENPQMAISKAIELIQQPGLKEGWAGKSHKLISEMTDVCRFLADFINSFPAKSIAREQADFGV